MFAKGFKIMMISVFAMMAGCATKEAPIKIIAASFKAKSDKVADVIKLAAPMIEASRAEAGCISYTLYQSPYDPTQFMFFEEWKDQAAIDSHFNEPHFKAFGPALGELTEGPSSLKIYDSVQQKATN